MAVPCKFWKFARSLARADRVPSTPFSLELKSYIVRLPDDGVALQAFIGNALIACYADYWTQDDPAHMTALEVSSLMKEFLFMRQSIGQIAPFLGIAPEGWLECNGTSYAKNQYPDLWDHLPANLKDPITFTLPDMRGHFLRGGNIGEALGSVSGEDEVTITEAQMPIHSHDISPHSHANLPHTHGEVIAVPSFVTAGELPVPVLVAVSGVGVTSPTTIDILNTHTIAQNTGGFEPHNNVPAYVAVSYWIQT